MHAYQGVRNVSFSKNFAQLLNVRSHAAILRLYKYSITATLQRLKHESGNRNHHHTLRTCFLVNMNN